MSIRPVPDITMPIINLLPWREARQLRRRHLFCLSLAASITLTFAGVAGVVQLTTSGLSRQEQVNDYLQADVAALQQRISEQEFAFVAHQQQQADFAHTRRIHAARFKQIRLLARLSSMLVPGLTLDRLRYDPPAFQLQGSAESALHVSRWLTLLDEHADISKTELQALYVEETSKPDTRQVYVYRIRIEISIPGFGFPNPGEGA